MPKTKFYKEPELSILLPIFIDDKHTSYIIDMIQSEIMPESLYSLNFDQINLLQKSTKIINFQWQVISQILYKKKWNHAVKIQEKLFKLFEPDADYIWSILNLVTEVNQISPTDTTVWGSPNDWFSLIIQEQKRAEMFSALNKIISTDNSKNGSDINSIIQVRLECLADLKAETNPFKSHGLPAFSCLIDTSLAIYKTEKYKEFNRNIWRGKSTKSRYQPKGFLHAYSQITQRMKEKGRYAATFENGKFHYRGSGNHSHPIPTPHKSSIEFRSH